MRGRYRRLADRAPDYVGALMMTVGSMHFVIPGLMAAQIPPILPYKKKLVYASGVIEVACGYGLKRRYPWAAKLSAATLLAIWPANLQMALDAGSHEGPGASLMNNQRLMWGRVPLQLPLIWAALQARPATPKPGASR
jgi:uncharacterized membrane protein